MAEGGKRIDLGAPLRSGRCADALPYHKADLKSGPVRQTGAVPFLWEQRPGQPKSVRTRRPPPSPPTYSQAPRPSENGWEEGIGASAAGRGDLWLQYCGRRRRTSKVARAQQAGSISKLTSAASPPRGILGGARSGRPCSSPTPLPPISLSLSGKSDVPRGGGAAHGGWLGSSGDLAPEGGAEEVVVVLVSTTARRCPDVDDVDKILDDVER